MRTPDPSLEQLRLRLTKLLPSAISFSGQGFRSTTPKYATETDLLTGEGSKRYGGRWNPPGIAVIYASLSPETAMAESLAHHRYYGLPVEDAMPRTFVAIDADLHHVLDFRDGQIRKRLQVSEERILTIDWRRELQTGHQPITHTIGRAAYEIGWEGVIVPSAAHSSGHNLLVFPDNLQSISRIAVQNPNRLETP